MAVTVDILSRDFTKAGFFSAQRNVQRLEASVTKATKTMKLLSVAAVAIGAKAVLSLASFDNKVREITTLLGDVTDKDIKSLGDEIKKTAVTYGQSLNSMAKARYDIISAGFNDAARSAVVLEQSAKLAVAGVSTVAETADLLTSSLNAYGFEANEAAKVSDILFTTVRLGKTTIPELAQNFGVLSSIAPTVGVKIEEVAAALATLTAAGQNTAIATTAIQATMASFLSPSEAMTEKLKTMGFETGAAAIKALGFQEALKQVVEGTNEAEKAAIFPNIRAMKGVFPLVGVQAEKFSKNLTEMGFTAGATDTAVAKMADGIQFKINQIKTQFSVWMTELGQKIVLLGGDFLKLDKDWQNLIITVGLFALAIKGLGLPIAAFIGLSYMAYQAWSNNIGGMQTITKLWLLDFKKDVSDIWRWISHSAGAVGHAASNIFKTFAAASTVDPKAKEYWNNIGEQWSEDQQKYNEESYKSSRDHWIEIGKTFKEGAANIGKLSDFLPDISSTVAGLKPDTPKTTTTAAVDASLLEKTQRTADGKLAIVRAMAETEKEIYSELGAFEIETMDNVQVNQQMLWEDRLTQAANVMDSLTSVAQQYYDLELMNIQRNSQVAITSAKKVYDAEKLRIQQTMSVKGKMTDKGLAAMANAEKQYQSSVEYYRAEADAKQRQAAKKLYYIKLAQAVTNTALGVTKAIGQGGLYGIITGALVAAAGAVQIATIRSQGYSSGTRFASPSKQIGSDTIPAMLTKGEAIIPASVVRQNAPLIQQLVGGQRQESSISAGDNITIIYNIDAVDDNGIRKFVQSEAHKKALIEMINDRKINLITSEGSKVTGRF